MGRMHTASGSPDSFQTVLACLPAGLDLDELAFSTKAIERRRVVGDGATLLRLGLARGPGGMSLNQTAIWAAASGLAQLSDPGLKYRLDKAAPFFKAVAEHLLAALPGAATLHWPGRSLRAVDGTHIKAPASQGSDWLVHAGFDLGLGRFRHLELTDKHGAESLARGAPLPGEIHIADRNFASANQIAHVVDASQGTADVIVRARWKSFTLRRDGAPFDLIAHLAALPPGAGLDEVTVEVKVTPERWLRLRLIIRRRPGAAVAATHRALRRNEKRKQKKLQPHTLTAAGFVILATTLPAEAYPADEVLAAYRLRWQIELAFKRLKSLLHIDKLPTHTPRASQSWLYAHLVMALICDELSQDLLETFP